MSVYILTSIIYPHLGYPLNDIVLIQLSKFHTVFFGKCEGVAHLKHWWKSLLSVCFLHIFARLFCKINKKYSKKEPNYGLFPNAGRHKNASPKKKV